LPLQEVESWFRAGCLEFEEVLREDEVVEELRRVKELMVAKMEGVVQGWDLDGVGEGSVVESIERGRGVGR